MDGVSTTRNGNLGFPSWHSQGSPLRSLKKKLGESFERDVYVRAWANGWMGRGVVVEETPSHVKRVREKSNGFVASHVDSVSFADFVHEDESPKLSGWNQTDSTFSRCFVIWNL